MFRNGTLFAIFIAGEVVLWTQGVPNWAWKKYGCSWLPRITMRQELHRIMEGGTYQVMWPRTPRHEMCTILLVFFFENFILIRDQAKCNITLFTPTVLSSLLLFCLRLCTPWSLFIGHVKIGKNRVLRINVKKGHSRSQIKKRNGKTKKLKLVNFYFLV